MKEDKHMQTTPPVGIYVKVPHLSHLILSGSAFIGEISNTNHQQFKITIFKWLLHISLANYIQHCKKITANRMFFWEKPNQVPHPQSLHIYMTTAHSPYPLLSSISLAVIGCVLKRSLVLRPPPDPPGR